MFEHESEKSVDSEYSTNYVDTYKDLDATRYKNHFYPSAVSLVSFKETEQLHPGDTISYYHPLYVAWSKDAFWSATIIKMNKNSEIILMLIYYKSTSQQYKILKNDTYREINNYELKMEKQKKWLKEKVRNFRT